ncbi:D-alanyl-D-alanine carboxypeptidase family protein [Arthrobacter sp. SDTb3-6]|uniref:M15 family metallopeptidase n=1 Tax=Arthrobacter sp. SDTb3-6 TaxID=2713571 RepID=UPI00210DD1FC|nr:M15 family metallopeptidase [Arthrobacter sp. SDTb3-6]
MAGSHQAPGNAPGTRRARPGAVLTAFLAVPLLAVLAFSLGGCFPRPTPGPSRAGAAPSVSPSTAPGPASAKTQRPASSSPASAAKPPVAGAPAGAPIQQLFAAGGNSLPDRALWDITDPSSVLVLVNKHHALVPRNYMPPFLVTPAVPTGSGEPALLRRAAAAAVGQMFAAAAADGVNMTVMSSFRSYATQVSLYNSYAAQRGAEAADTASARPGYSEHQTGFALDIGDAAVPASCAFTWCMASSPAGLWVAGHAAKYGFVVRYQLGLEGTTGYLAEPWHLRFVGAAVAQDMSRRGILTYEQYLGLPGAPGYE